MDRVAEPGASPRGVLSPLADMPLTKKTTPVATSLDQLALNVVKPPAPVRGIVCITPPLSAAVPASMATNFPTGMGLMIAGSIVVRYRPAIGPLVCETVTVSVTACPTAGLLGLAASVTIGTAPPP